MRITNIDTLSAFLDRLVTERIKHFFFAKDGRHDMANHQEKVVSEIKVKIAKLLKECYVHDQYDYLPEKRTFNEEAIVKELDELIVNDIRIGEGDRARLEEIKKPSPDLDSIIKNEKLTRISNEGRSRNKNNIDQLFSKIFGR